MQLAFLDMNSYEYSSNEVYKINLGASKINLGTRKHYKKRAEEKGWNDQD